MSEPIEVTGTAGPGVPDRRWSGARVWGRDERFRMLMGRITPGGLMVAGAGVAWHRPDLAGWLITGGLGLTGAGLEAWRTWLAYQYAVTELRYADQAQQRAGDLDQRRLELSDQHDVRQHELALLAHSLHEARRSARLDKVAEDKVTELARIEEVEDLWSTPIPDRSASLTIDLRENPLTDVGGHPAGDGNDGASAAPVRMPSPRRPRGPDRYRTPGAGPLGPI
jgi:hypothetical protein